MDYNLEGHLKLPSLGDHQTHIPVNGAAPDIGMTLSPEIADGDNIGSANLQLFGLGGYATNNVHSLSSPQMQEQNMLFGQLHRQVQGQDGRTPNTYTDSNNSNNNNNKHSPAAPNTSGNGIRSGGPSEEELYQRRKAQNRAAQRAFRERKEGKIKELSSKLQDAELSREKLEQQLKELKEKNKRLNLENQILQKQQQYRQHSQTFNSKEADLKKDSFTVDKSHVPNLNVHDVISFKFPNTSKCEFIDGTIDWASHGLNNESEFYASKIGESYRHENTKVLTISAVWDYLVEFANLNEEYTLDIPGIMNELRGKEVCHGFGPAYPHQLVNDIILRHLDDRE